MRCIYLFLYVVLSCLCSAFFFFKQKTAYEMRISDWSSYVCSSDLNVAAFFVEPVIGSGGVIVPPAGWLTAMQQTCRDLDILFAVDEVITGFGRTGPLFACEHEGLTPDILTVAKGLTAGYAPMGATFLSDRIYRAIADNTPPGVAVGHGMKIGSAHV